MSFQCTSWASTQKCGSAASKLVLLMLANHTNGHTGQCNPSHRKLADECEMSVDTLKTHLKSLAEKGLITIVPQFFDGVQLPNQYKLNVVTGINLHGGGGDFSPHGGGNFSVGGGGDFSPPNKQELNQEYKRKCLPQAADASETEIQKAKKAEKAKAKAEKEAELQALFDELWNEYPRKDAKKPAYQSFVKQNITRETISLVVDKVRRAKLSEQWADKRFIPMCATWLNQRRWEDEEPQETADSDNAWWKGAL